MSPEGSPGEPAAVLDASALLAMLHAEPGGDVVKGLLQTAAISTVNWSEVVQKALDRKVEVQGLRQDLEALGLKILPFTADQAERTASLRSETQHLGLSLGDRACLALAAELSLPAVTADRVWRDLSIGIEIRVAR
jgi:ribonuclease VapC